MSFYIILRTMLHAIRSLLPASLALIGSLSVISCDKVDSLLGDHKQEMDSLREIEMALQTKISETEKQISQAKAKQSEVTYEIDKILNSATINTYDIKSGNIDNLPAQKRSVERIYFALMDMKKELDQLSQTTQTLKFQFDSYEQRLNEFKKDHPID